MALNQPAWIFARFSRAMMPALGCFIFGLALAAHDAESFSKAQWLWLALCWFCIWLGFLVLSGRRTVLLLVSWILSFLLGYGYYIYFHWQPGALDASHQARGQSVRLEGELWLNQDDAKKGVLRLGSLEGHPAEGLVLLRFGRVKPPPAGSLVSISGRLSLADTTTIPGAFDEQRYLSSQHMAAVLHHVGSISVRQSEPISVYGRLNRILASLRGKIAATFKQALPSPLWEIVGGIVLGDQAIPLDASTRQMFVDTGLIHLLAASGMNIAIVSGFVFMLARLLRLPMRLQLILAMLAAAVYAMLSGLSPSVMRAAAMLEIALLLKFANRKLSNTYVLLLAVVALLLWNPNLITSIGFQLSVLTTFGIITMVGPLQAWLGHYLTRNIAGLLLLPLVAQLWAMPLLICYFNALPVLSPALNILVVPIVSILTCLGFAAGLLSLLYQPLAIGLTWLAWPFAQSLLWIVQLGQSLPGGLLFLPSWPAGALIAVYLILVGVAVCLNYPAELWRDRLSRLNAKRIENGLDKIPFTFKVIALLLILIINAVVFTYIRFNPLAVDQISVLPLERQQAAFLLESPALQQPVLLMPADASLWHSRKVGDYLRHRGITTLAAVVWYATPQSWVQSGHILKLRSQIFSRVNIRRQYSNVPIGQKIAISYLAQNQALRLGYWQLSTSLDGPAIISNVIAGPLMRLDYLAEASRVNLEQTTSKNAIASSCFSLTWRKVEGAASNRAESLNPDPCKLAYQQEYVYFNPYATGNTDQKKEKAYRLYPGNLKAGQFYQWQITSKDWVLQSRESFL